MNEALSSGSLRPGHSRGIDQRPGFFRGIHDAAKKILGSRFSSLGSPGEIQQDPAFFEEPKSLNHIGSSNEEKKSKSLKEIPASIESFDPSHLLVNLLGDYLTETDYLQLGRVSKTFRELVKPMLILKKCNASLVYPDIKIIGPINLECAEALKKLRDRKKISEMDKTDPVYSLNFKSVQINDWKYVNLADVITVDEKNFLNNHADHDMAKKMLKLADIQKIEISKVDLNDMFYYHYKNAFSVKNVRLRELTLTRCRISNNFAELLASFMKSAIGLQKLVLDELKLNMESKTILYSAIQDLTSLKSLTVIDNSEQSPGDCLLETIVSNKLEEFNYVSQSILVFSDNLLSLEGGLIYANNLKKLEISTPFIRADILAGSLTKLDKLEEFSFKTLPVYEALPNDSRGKLRLYKAVSKLSKLKRLSIVANLLGSNETRYLHGLKNLESLKLLFVRDNENIRNILETVRNECPRISSLCLDSGSTDNLIVSHESIMLLDALILKLKDLTLRSMKIPMSNLGGWAQKLQGLHFSGYDRYFSNSNWLSFVRKVKQSKTLKRLTFELYGAPATLDPNEFMDSVSLQTIKLQGKNYVRQYAQAKFKDVTSVPILSFHHVAAFISYRKDMWLRLVKYLGFLEMVLLLSLLLDIGEDEMLSDK